MTLLGRALAVLVFVVAVVALLLSLTVGVGVWVVKKPATEFATRKFDKAEAALDKADRGLAIANDVLANAARNLEEVRQQQRRTAPRDNLARRLMAQTVQRAIAPQLGEAQVTLNAIAEGLVVAQSVLEDVSELPQDKLNVDAERLSRLQGQLSQAAPAAWELSRLLGNTEQDADAQCSQVEQLLRSLQSMASEYESRLAEVRQETERARAKTLAWITPAAAIISFASFWIALSQISVMAHVRSYWRWLGRSRA
jgi:hypothetical protein